MLFLLSSLGPVNGPKLVRLYIAAALAVEISVDSAGYSQGAFGRCPETTAYLLDLLPIQYTSAAAN